MRLLSIIFVFIFSLFHLQIKDREADLVDKISTRNLKINELTDFAKKNFNTESEISKFYYYWISKNIQYDNDLFQKIKNSSYISEDENQKDIDEIFSKKKAICQGYANLYKYFLDKSNIKNEVISGYSKTYETYKNFEFTKTDRHAWNAVFINNRWILVDTTWSSNRYNESKENYYDINPRNFILTHFTTDCKWQLLKKCVTKEDFKKSDYIDNFYFEKGFSEAPQIKVDSKFIYFIVKNNPHKNWHINLKYELSENLFETLICKFNQISDYKIFYFEKNKIPKSTYIRMDLTDFDEKEQTLTKFQNVGFFKMDIK